MSTAPSQSRASRTSKRVCEQAAHVADAARPAWLITDEAAQLAVAVGNLRAEPSVAAATFRDESPGRFARLRPDFWRLHRWDWLGGATERMLDAAGVTRGARVLDVAAGSGGQSLDAARRVGPHGHVLATDISPTILSYAARAAEQAGLSNLEVQAQDGERLDVEPGAFDAVICRLGLIYFPDQQAALKGMYRALRPGGRLAAVVYSTADRNGFFAVPVSIIRRRAQLPAPLRLGSTDDCVRFARESFGALHQMLGGLAAADQADVWAEITRELRQFETADGDRPGFEGTCELLVAAGTR